MTFISTKKCFLYKNLFNDKLPCIDFIHYVIRRWQRLFFHFLHSLSLSYYCFDGQKYFLLSSINTMKGLNKNCCRAISIFLSKYQSLLMRTSFHSLVCLIQELIATMQGQFRVIRSAPLPADRSAFSFLSIAPCSERSAGVELLLIEVLP